MSISLLLSVYGLTAARAQVAQPLTSTSPTEELPARLLLSLAEIEDFSFDFDHPAFYELVAYVKENPQAPGHTRDPLIIDDWRVLLERPADYRGLPITIEGLIGRNKDPYKVTRHPELEQLWQVELRRADQAMSVTIIFTNDVSDLPLSATIRVTGYFVKINRYPTKSKKEGLAALLVAPGPTAVSVLGAVTTESKLDWRWLLAAALVGVLVTFWLIWRASRSGERRDVRLLRAEHSAPESLADELAEWAERERPDENDER
ncbi:MAG: hypothetical protein ABIG44_10385 [Planctomycetota bacterium]